MINKQLLDYITYKVNHGLSIQAVQQKLIAEGGWNQEDIKEALISLNLSPAPVKPKPVVSVFPSTPTYAPTPAPTFTPPPVSIPPLSRSIPASSPIPPPRPIVMSQPTPVTSPVQSVPQTPPTPPVTAPPRFQSPPPVQTMPSPVASSIPQPPPRAPLPQVSASRTFVAPVQQPSRSHSGVRTLGIILFILLLGGAGAYVYFYQFDTVQSLISKITGKNSSTEVSTTKAPVKSAPIPVTPVIIDNASYSFSVPKGWKSSALTSTGHGLQASNTTMGYAVSVAITAIPETAGVVKSIDDIMTPDTTEKIIKSEFAGSVLGKVTSGTLGGEKAAVIAFTVASTSTASGASSASSTQKLAILQYSAIHAGTMYSVVFRSNLDKGTGLIKDAESIVKSFVFK